MEYKGLGLKSGLEIHQQLNTHKLFCNCPSVIRKDEPDIKIKRKLRAVPGELGNIDIAAEYEQIKAKEIIYEGYSNSNCLIETDEEPPHEINHEALNIALEIASALNMKPVNEIQIMRKTVIDGSNTSGFQRTALVATNGFLNCSFGKVSITDLCLEEDAARKISEDKKSVVYRLDRLGIPLVEIRTEPDMHSPEQVREVAEKIGLILRLTGKVKRGIGTIRQDVNVSIAKGNRVEIKGAQNLGHLAHLVKNEAARQVNMLWLSDKLKKVKISDIKDITDVLKKTKCKFINKSIKEGNLAFAVSLSNAEGLVKKQLQANQSFGGELAEIAIKFGLGGIIHSDELPAYGIEEKEEIYKKLGTKKKDAFLFLVSEKEKGILVLNKIIQRIDEFKKGVPKDVRKANFNGTTSYLRPLPGKARMYPETDLPPFKITKEVLKQIKIPKSPEEVFEDLKKIGLSEEVISQLVFSPRLSFFNELIKQFKSVKPSIIAKTILDLKEIKKRFNVDIGKIKEIHIKETLELLNKNLVSKEGIIEILKELALNPNEKAENIAKKLGLKLLEKQEVEEAIKKVISENKGLKSPNALMGIAMEKLKGKADGGLIFKLLKELTK